MNRLPVLLEVCCKESGDRWSKGLPASGLSNLLQQWFYS